MNGIAKEIGFWGVGKEGNEEVEFAEEVLNERSAEKEAEFFCGDWISKGICFKGDKMEEEAENKSDVLTEDEFSEEVCKSSEEEKEGGRGIRCGGER